MNNMRRLIIGITIGAAVLGVLYLYSRPDFLVQMSNQIWACF